ncbi:MAG: DsrE family protein [Acidiferrobacterales bacterium]
MRFARVTVPLIAVLALFLSPAASHAAVVGKNTGVVIQVSNKNPEAWGLTLLNIRYIQEQMGKKRLPIEVVAFGPGVYMLTRNSKVRQGLRRAMHNGVRFVACEASMHTRRLAEKDMYPGVAFTPLGIAEIIKKQRAGWSYLKP